ncbi:MAG: V-type ATPase subunit [Thermoprotei archaeon]
MPNAVWTGLYGRLKTYSTSFLSLDQINALARSKDVKEFVQQLTQTWYRAYLEQFSAEYRPPELVEVAVNSHLAALNQLVVSSSPVYGRGALLAYLSKWDIYNIELILAAKAQNSPLKEAQKFLVSARNIPVSLGGVAIGFNELRLLLQQPDIESLIKETVKYGYGASMLEKLGEYRESGDLGVFSAAIYRKYYSDLLWQLRFLRGDEGSVRDYVRAEISKKNMFSALKALDSKMSREQLMSHLIDGGFVPASSLAEAYASGSRPEIVRRFSSCFDVEKILEQGGADASLAKLETAVDQEVVSRYAKKIANNSLSAVSSIAFLIRAETERANIRRVLYGVAYGMPEQDISGMILKW